MYPMCHLLAGAHDADITHATPLSARYPRANTRVHSHKINIVGMIASRDTGMIMGMTFLTSNASDMIRPDSAEQLFKRGFFSQTLCFLSSIQTDYPHVSSPYKGADPTIDTTDIDITGTKYSRNALQHDPHLPSLAGPECPRSGLPNEPHFICFREYPHGSQWFQAIRSVYRRFGIWYSAEKPSGLGSDPGC